VPFRKQLTLALRDFGHEWRMSSSFVVALAITLVAASLSALLGGLRSARIQPSDGLRKI